MEQDKTSLTKASVEGSDETESSLQRQGNDGLNDSDEKDEKGVSWKNRAMEHQKRSEALSEKLDRTISELEELKATSSRRDLTAKEERRMDQLEGSKDDIERELHIFNTDPQFRAANEKINRSAKNAVTEAKKQMYAELVDDFLESEAESRGMKAKELRQEVNKFVRSEHMEYNPLKKTKLALKEFDSYRKFQKEREEFEKKRESSEHNFEIGDKLPRTNNLKDSIAKNDINSQMKHLGL